MDQKALFLKFWEKEAPATRKVISRIPNERSDYRADPKARSARELAWLIVQEEIVLAEGLEKGVLEFGGQEVMRASGYENAWGFLFDHIHHRGQLSTYLRPMGSTVPQIYGPSADEPM